MTSETLLKPLGDDLLRRLRNVADGVGIYGAPDPSLVESRIRHLANELESVLRKAAAEIDALEHSAQQAEPVALTDEQIIAHCRAAGIEWLAWRLIWRTLAPQPPSAKPVSACPEKRKPGGCQLRNLHCGYPACDAAGRRQGLEEASGEYEVRSDGVTARKDRWEVGIRRIVALLWGNRHEFEVDDVVDAVRRIVSAPFNDGDDEGLVRAVLGSGMPAQTRGKNDSEVG